MSIKPKFKLKSKDNFFTMGSCFAREVRNWLKSKNLNVYPDFDKLDKILESKLLMKKTDTGKIIGLNDRLIWYNTFTILYEFQRLNGDFIQKEDDIWTEEGYYQDPYRRLILSKDKKYLIDAIKIIDNHIYEGIKNASVIIITLGLTEVWFQEKNNYAICSHPNYAGKGGNKNKTDKCYFKSTTYSENFNNLKKTVDIILKRNPQCKIILTVSPVPLAQTFVENTSTEIANCYSKSLLRVVATDISNLYDNIQYFHSYELAVNSNKNEVYQEDNRHIKDEFVDYIMKEFSELFL